MTDMETDELRDSYLYAIQAGYTQEAIAKNSGVPVESLRKFKQGEALGAARRKKLQDWLTDSGMVRGASQSDPARVIANELRNLADVLESGIDIETKRKRLAEITKALPGFRWPRNAMRHSFASYHLAAFRNATLTAHELGHHSPALLYSTYRTLATEADGRAYFDLFPPNFRPTES